VSIQRLLFEATRNIEEPRELATVTIRLPVLFLSEPKASERFCAFFTANIRNKNTRRAYYKAGPTTGQSNSIRSAAKCCLTAGLESSCSRSSIKAATWIGFTSAKTPVCF